MQAPSLASTHRPRTYRPENVGSSLYRALSLITRAHHQKTKANRTVEPSSEMSHRYKTIGTSAGFETTACSPTAKTTLTARMSKARVSARSLSAVRSSGRTRSTAVSQKRCGWYCIAGMHRMSTEILNTLCVMCWVVLRRAMTAFIDRPIPWLVAVAGNFLRSQHLNK